MAIDFLCTPRHATPSLPAAASKVWSYDFIIQDPLKKLGG
jgi:hypothetical protein